MFRRMEAGSASGNICFTMSEYLLGLGPYKNIRKEKKKNDGLIDQCFRSNNIHPIRRRRPYSLLTQGELQGGISGW